MSASTPFVESLFDVGGHRLAIYRAGEGAPTVVLDAGLGDKAAIWRLVQQRVAQFAHVCSYDRAGRGRSELGPAPRSSASAVAELHALLAAAGEAPPYILVGHSFGGLNMLLYAHEYAAEVAGLVLVDASHPRMDLLAALPAEQPGESAALSDVRTLLRNQTLENPEQIDFAASYAQAQAVATLGDMPLIVISHAPERWIDDLSNFFPDLPPAILPRMDADWQELQREYLRLSPHSEQIIAHESGHNIPADEPQLIADAIHKLVVAARG